MKVTLYRGGASKATTVNAPAVVGLRPGYVYYLKLTDIPGYAQPLYPTLEVRGSLTCCKVKPRDFPAALVLSPQDIEAVRAGSYVTKVIVLEKVDSAAPESTTADSPILVQTVVGENPIEQAQELGTPFLIMRLGQRTQSEEELQSKGLFGTLQLPDEKVMAQPQVAPYLPWLCPGLYDPKLGPNPGCLDQCLPDGGESGLRVGYDIDGKLAGLDAADTVAEYVDSKGNRKIAVSNRVCICVPRFVVVRNEVKVQSQDVIAFVAQTQNLSGGMTLKNITPLESHHQNIMLGVLASRLSLSSTLAALGTVAYGQYKGLEMYVNINGPRGVTSTCKTEESELPDGPLCLIKWPDRYAAALGDTLMFTLKYTNQGKQPIRQVVVSDSLVSRYEYVLGSQQSDRLASFTTQPNEAGSLILRWEINEELPPGESGIVRFQVKIR
jgi:uncharacterized repeat protein (TIGR01451 family)